jgi:CheY-specific phosphatase CheX
MLVEHESIVSQVFCDVMEKLTFMFGEEVGIDELYPEGDNYHIVTMTFSGYKKGSIKLIVPESMAGEIAANVLGVSETDSRTIALALDSLKEVVNVLCGRILTELEGDKPIFNLSVPETQSINEKQWEKYLQNEEYMAFVVDGFNILLDFQIED